MSYDIFTYTLGMDYDGDVSIDFSAGQSYYFPNGQFSGNAPWSVTLYVDGNPIINRYGAGAVTDVVSLLGAVRLGGGSHQIIIRWDAINQITISGSTLRILVTYR
jgi:hypothetical protein